MTDETDEIRTVDDSEIPSKLHTNETAAEIAIQSTPDDEEPADGVTEPYGWIDLRNVPNQPSLLLDADEAVLEAEAAELVLDYPMENTAVRTLRPADGRAFTRGELVTLIDDTYRRIYSAETATQSSPTPPIEERGQLINRPASDGTFGIWGHDLDDLGIERIYVYRVDDRVWLKIGMVS